MRQEKKFRGFEDIRENPKMCDFIFSYYNYCLVISKKTFPLSLDNTK